MELTHVRDLSDPSGTALPSRLRLLVALTVLAGLVLLLQLTRYAPLPHSADDFLGGVVVGLAVSAAIARVVSRA
jgi:uncharacterized membrane protein